MPSKKLISLLNEFSKTELNRLRKFLSSPYFNDQEDVLRLFEWLNSQLRKGVLEADQKTKQQVWKNLYGNAPLDDAHLRRLSSDLNLLALQFMVAEARQKNEVAEALELQKVLEKPAYKAHLNSVERQLQKQLEATTAPSAETYLAGFQLHWTIFNRASTVLSTTNYIDKLLPADHYLERFYVVQKLKMYIAWLSFRNFRATEEAFLLPPGFWEYIRQPLFSEVPIIAINCKVVDCLLDPNDETHFQSLMTDLEALGDALSKEDLRECYHIAQNYCALKINQGKTEYYRAVFTIFKSLIINDILLTETHLSEGMYKNIITVSLRVGEFGWAENFVREYSEFLPADIRDNAQTFNLANLYSHQKKHDKVIELLRNVEYSDLVYALSSKLILVRTYYETDEFMALDSLIDSFRIFLRRNKQVSKSVKLEYNNFLGFVKKLSTLPPSNPKMVETLRIKIERCNAVVSKKWLLEKIVEF
jgi:hypothetical protein